MITPEGAREHEPAAVLRKGSGFDMEVLVGYILLVGVLLSVALILTGVVWNWIASGHLELSYSIQGANFLKFTVGTTTKILQGKLNAENIVNLGIVTLLLTPYLRVLASVIYFAFALHNWKYTLFTAFVFAVLTYSLLFR